MKYVHIPPSAAQRQLPFFLAMEEYVARRLRPGESRFFMWRVEPTVIFGRNQVIDREVNLEYCRANGIEVYRRRSGGGCVFADMSNIMFSFMEAGTDTVAESFARYSARVVCMLRSLGLNATNDTRNDILVDGRKVSGNAYYRLPSSCIIHGTMLFGTDMSHMASAITPSKAKLQARGVESVRSRVTTLDRYLDMTIEDFMDYARNYMCSGEISLTDADVEEIEELAKPYYDNAWIYGRRTMADTVRKALINGAGEFTAIITAPHGVIEAIELNGDFLTGGDVDTQLLDCLRGTELSRRALADALAHTDVGAIIHGLDREKFIELLTD